MTTAPISIALYNEGAPSAGFDWVPGAEPLAFAELAETYVANVCADGGISTVRIFSIEAPVFEDDQCNDLLEAWLYDHVIPTTEGPTDDR